MVLAALVVLAGILVPSLSAAKNQARLAACAVQMRSVGTALRQFAACNENRMPPFAFSDHVGNLPLSGHWGGMSQGADPDCFGRRAVDDVNLWRLVAERLVTPRQLICPAEPCARGVSGYFPHTLKFSTYCLRMPYSEDIFRQAPALAHYSGRGLLGVYTAAGSGHSLLVGQEFPGWPTGPIPAGGRPRATVPYVRVDLTYREADPVTGEQRMVELGSGAVLADTFWYQRRHKPAGAVPGLETYEVRAGWCHGERFNVLFGDGAVHAIRDDGTVAANSVGPDAELPYDGYYFASKAMNVWRHFGDRR